jgi:hypothetical protein
VTLSLPGWKERTVASATFMVPVEAPKAEGKAAEGKQVEKPPAAKPAAKESPSATDLLQAQRERLLIEEQKLTQEVATTLHKARRTYADEPEAARKLLRQAVLRVWDHPDLSERVREALLNRLVAARGKLGQEQ